MPLKVLQQARELIEEFVYFYTHERIQNRKWHRLRCATPLKFIFPAQNLFLCCPYSLGRLIACVLNLLL